MPHSSSAPGPASWSLLPRGRTVTAWVAAALALACLLTLAPATASAAGGAAAPSGPLSANAWHPGPEEAVPGSLLVTAESPEAAAGLRAALPSEVVDLGGAAHALGERLTLVRFPAGYEQAAAAALLGREGVQAVEPDLVRRFSGDAPSDPLYPLQWAHEQARVEGAWSRETGSRDVRIAIIDSGVLGSHPELRENIFEQVDASTGIIRPREAGIDNDTCALGHGTAVAGVIGAVGDNGDGIAGVAWEVGILDISVNAVDAPTGCEGISDSAILAGIAYATNHPSGPVDVVNLSLGAPQSYCPEAYDTAIQAARAAGVVVVAAAGNIRAGLTHVPASCPGVISVGATDRDGERASYSAANPWVDLVGPGGTEGEPANQILTTSHDGGYVLRRGTSFAAAYVAGVAVLLRSTRPDLTPADVESVLERTAEREPLGVRDTKYGWGRVRADRALNYVRRRDVIEPPEPDPFFPVLRLHPAPAEEPLTRVAAEEAPTTPVDQAVAVSRALFRDGGAVHAVFAREDAYADALAGSAITLGLGPLFFSGPDGEVAPAVRRELRRALPQGGTVYLLGGEASVPDEVRALLVRLGYVVVRLSGPSRDETAVAVADEVVRQRADLGLEPPRTVILVSRADWPDAVAAGSIAARFGIPIVLASSHFLHPATEDFLARTRPERVVVVGGTERVAAMVGRRAGRVAGGASVDRLSGGTRAETAIAVAEEMHALSGQQAPRFAVAVNLRHEEGFTHALTASAFVGAHSGFFVPVEEADGTVLPEAAERFIRGLGVPAVVMGGGDLVAEETAQRLRAGLEGVDVG